MPFGVLAALFLLLLPLGWPANTGASPGPEGRENIDLAGVFGERGCSEQVVALLYEWDLTGPWRDLPAEMRPGDAENSVSHRFRAQTARIGTWLEVERLRTSGRPVVRRISPESITRVEWDENCGVTLAQTPVRAGTAVDPSTVLRDADLTRETSKLKAGEIALVLVWSPRMHFSAPALRDAHVAAARLGARLLVARDPFVSAKEAQAFAAREVAGRNPADLTRRLEAVDLLVRGAPDHYPSLWALGRRGVIGSPFFGLASADRYERWAREHRVAAP